ncbi:sigma-70 family RNA polymerase sigma factor [Thiomicrorhabdus sp. ZW0627]|uniref:sigma-70 family RNA polymerase sigma factor n=1 Tax=Thiomicrorhabdus sp. ZW0627 TaxID=3039774 RepID=UPI002436A547|nr:sigma-70 family RNA polymerase sigma factor [Thiomicrorhabdus sp. ZW0627]MDG6773725.1 sigma-70 family RNA polymerase sigma factor [Thiomicrorhabdus sp. ZW0627]
MDNKHRFFEQLVSAYSNDLYRYAYWLCKQPTVAEDLVQETFSRAWKSLDKLHDEKAAKAWLITILRHENARMYEKFQPQLVEIEESLASDDGSNEPSLSLEQHQLHQAIMELPVEYKEPLILQILWGFSGEEISEQLDLKLATVNTRLFRARHQLKEILNGHTHNPSKQISGKVRK